MSTELQFVKGRTSLLAGCALCCLLVVAPVSAASILDRPVELVVDAGDVRQALGQVAAANDLRIEIEGELTRTPRKLLFSEIEIPLSAAMRHLLEGESYVIAEVDGALRIRLAGGGPISVIEPDPWLETLRRDVAAVDADAAELLDDFLAQADSDEREGMLSFLKLFGDDAAGQWLQRAREALLYEAASKRTPMGRDAVPGALNEGEGFDEVEAEQSDPQG